MRGSTVYSKLLSLIHLQVLGVQSDVLFPVTQQRELENLLKEARKYPYIFRGYSQGVLYE